MSKQLLVHEFAFANLVAKNVPMFHVWRCLSKVPILENCFTLCSVFYVLVGFSFD